ncbi:MAG: 3-(cis-5,6-dihydroxycyclohexa-1,3-dien-1-yl)propanoate dehydrogenase [Streptosporangiaceae bacterium]
MGWLEGKATLVIGAGSGIGRAVLDAFLAEGARVAAFELDEGKCTTLASDLPATPLIQGDATSYEDNRRAVAATVGALGGLDVLVNCVGVFDFYRPLAGIDDDAFDHAFREMFDINVKSQLLAVKAALPALRAARGAVVLTVSTSGFYPGRGGTLYVTSKFAVRGAVVELAHELAPEVRVNGVAPGGTVGTDLRGAGSLGLGDRRLDDRPERADDLKSRTPLAVALSADDHTGAYVYLASDRSRGTTGTVLHSDGGIGVKG